ncbi:transposase [Lacihabitans lacunae]|uniref:Transposase n=1 Tax=Lacihabitans lacunae TaxID=1028214 RepID=A0ABV7Z4L6_9BACT
MENIKRKFTSDFKLKVILEALKEQQTLAELSQKYELHPNQISVWKTEFLAKAKQTLELKKPKPSDSSPELEQMFAKIGKLQMELDYLKKKLS